MPSHAAAAVGRHSNGCGATVTATAAAQRQQGAQRSDGTANRARAVRQRLVQAAAQADGQAPGAARGPVSAGAVGAAAPRSPRPGRSGLAAGRRREEEEDAKGRGPGLLDSWVQRGSRCHQARWTHDQRRVPSAAGLRRRPAAEGAGAQPQLRCACFVVHASLCMLHRACFIVHASSCICFPKHASPIMHHMKRPVRTERNTTLDSRTLTALGPRPQICFQWAAGPRCQRCLRAWERHARNNLKKSVRDPRNMDYPPTRWP